MKTIFKEFAKCRGLSTMGLGMLIAGAFLHLVSAIVMQVIFPLLEKLTGYSSMHSSQMMIHEMNLTLPHLIFAKGSVGQTLLVFIIVSICSYYFLKWSNRLQK